MQHPHDFNTSLNFLIQNEVVSNREHAQVWTHIKPRYPYGRHETKALAVQVDVIEPFAGGNGILLGNIEGNTLYIGFCLRA